MSATERPVRADAQRNRERVLAAARELFARSGNDVQMEEIAARAGVGVGTLYRRFPTKEALLIEIARERFAGFLPLAEEAEGIADAYEAFATFVTRVCEDTQDDVGFQLAMLGPKDLNADVWAGVEREKERVGAVIRRIIDRGVAEATLRPDMTYDDFPILMCALAATMHFKPGRAPDWRRQLAVALDGLAGPAHRG